MRPNTGRVDAGMPRGKLCSTPENYGDGGQPGRLYRLFWRSKSGGSQPLAHVSARLCLPGSADQGIAGCTRLQFSCFFAEAFCFFCKTFFKRLDVFETATLHDTPRSLMRFLHRIV